MTGHSVRRVVTGRSNRRESTEFSAYPVSLVAVYFLSVVQIDVARILECRVCEMTSVSRIDSHLTRIDSLWVYWTTLLIKGRDGVVRGARLRAGKSYLERAIQHLCPMELSCDVRETPQSQQVQLNPRARDFTPRQAAIVAAQRIRDLAEKESE